MFAGFKSALHPLIDPLLSLPDQRQAESVLAALPDGIYRAPIDVPYYPQFASPDRIYDYIHHNYDGTTDPNWQSFGTPEPGEYAFWAPRICALAVLKMAIEAFYPDRQPSLWQLVQEGLAVKGYTVRDEQGRWIDQGWYVHAQIHLAQLYGLQTEARSYISPLRICDYIQRGWLVAASVTPELGERQPSGRRYGGHVVLVHGFEWKQGQLMALHLHNPSGRFAELQANAEILAQRFRTCFAHRLIALNKKSGGS
jgi:hypothetical protein